MIDFEVGGARFSYKAAGVALDGERVLLTQLAGGDFWFLPGGRVELHEPATEALRRELREELGVEVEVGRLLWLGEHFYEDERLAVHEVGLYFAMTIPDVAGLHGRRGPFPGCDETMDLLFRWHRLDMLPAIRLYPRFLPGVLRALPATPRHIVCVDSAKRRRTGQPPLLQGVGVAGAG